MRKIAMFMNLKADDREKAVRRNAFLSGLKAEVASRPDLPDLQKIRLILRHADRGALEDTHPLGPDREYKDKARDLANSHADIYFASCWPTMNALDNATSPSDKIVVAGIFDPSGPSDALVYPSKIYGCISYDNAVADVWVKRLMTLKNKSGAQVNKVGVVHDVRIDNERTKALFDKISKAVNDNGLGVADKIDVRAYDLDRKIAAFARDNSAGGLIAPAGTFTAIHRAEIIQYINDEGIPTVYPNRFYVTTGGLVSYGADLLEVYRKAGAYAGKLLKGETISDSDRLVRNKDFELVVNSKLAKRQLSTDAYNQLMSDADLIIDEE